MKHIGILAHSADGAAHCFLEMIRESARQLGVHEHPEITLSIRAMGPILPAYESGDLEKVNEFLMQSARRLATAGCDFFVCPDNTAHLAFDAATEPPPLPMLHIAEIVATCARSNGYHRVALLGTRWTMEGSAYPRAFAHAGVDLAIPSPGDRALVDWVIFEQLCQGVIASDSRDRFVEIIAGLKAAGCDAVALSCTEIPLLIAPDVSPLPTLDSTRLLAHAAVEVAINMRPMP